MKNDKIHLVPPNVLDCGENLLSSKHETARYNYLVRLEAIREYCDNVINKHKMRSNTNMFKRPGVAK